MVDITMRGMKGWQLIGTLKSEPTLAGLPIIVGAVVDDEPLGFALGLTDHIGKPVQRNALLACLQRLGIGKPGLPVMLVEDNPDDRDIIETYLGAEGFQVMAASSGREAINWLSVFKVGLVLIDLLTDGISGFAVLAHIRQHKALNVVPVVVISGALSAEEEDAFNGSIADVIRQQQAVRREWVQGVIGSS
jgi:CheY-like chemotaxis protein